MQRETTVCAKVEREPDIGITGKGDRRREKVWLIDAEKQCQVDKRREGRGEAVQGWSVELFSSLQLD